MVLESASILEIADRNLWTSFAISLHQNIPTPRAQSFYMFLYVNANVFRFFLLFVLPTVISFFVILLQCSLHLFGMSE